MTKENYRPYTVGRRKTAIVQLFLTPGNGKIFINNKIVSDYFVNSSEQIQIYFPLKLTKLENRYDCTIKVKGGGVVGQIGAIRLGLARAICKQDSSKRIILKQYKLLSRDARVKERKKYGLKKARKAPQYSKR